MQPTAELLRLVDQPSQQPLAEPIRKVGEDLAEHFRESIQGILFYGSCLRMNNPHESLVDCYVLVNRYSNAFSSWWLSLLNHVLPPNVFYREVPLNGQVIRVKYSVLTLADFEQCVSLRRFHSYFWGRFAQPTVIVFTKSEEVRNRILQGLAMAVLTFFRRVLPCLSAPFSAYDFWRRGLTLSYGAELRSESSGRFQTLWDSDSEYYERVAEALLPASFPGSSILESVESPTYSYDVSGWQRTKNALGWMFRRIQGKFLSVLRLMKAAYTFQGGVDYLIWKIERHSGVKIELTPQQRRHPILAGLWAFWRLYRQGAFR